jgi:hypothetical protein
MKFVHSHKSFTLFIFKWLAVLSLDHLISDSRCDTQFSHILLFWEAKADSKRFCGGYKLKKQPDQASSGQQWPSWTCVACAAWTPSTSCSGTPSSRARGAAKNTLSKYLSC